MLREGPKGGPKVGLQRWTAVVLLNALNSMKARQLGAGKFSDGQGLWLVKRNVTHGKWILRVSIDGQRREMGLGRFPDVSIAEARQRAAEASRKEVSPAWGS